MKPTPETRTLYVLEYNTPDGNFGFETFDVLKEMLLYLVNNVPGDSEVKMYRSDTE